MINRDIWLLTSKEQGRTFAGTNTSHWNIGACVMSILAASETEEQAWFGLIEPGSHKVTKPIAAPGTPRQQQTPARRRQFGRDSAPARKDCRISR